MAFRSTGTHVLPESERDPAYPAIHTTVAEFGPRRVGIFEPHTPGATSMTLRVVDPEKPEAVLASAAIPHQVDYTPNARLAAPLGRGRCLVLFATPGGYFYDEEDPACFVAVASYSAGTVALGPRLPMTIVRGANGATVETVENAFLYALDQTRARLLIEQEIITYDEFGALPPVVTYRRDTCVLTVASDGQVTRSPWAPHAVPMRHTGRSPGSGNAATPLLVREGSLYSFDGRIRRHDAENPGSTLATSDFILESVGGYFASAPNFSPQGTIQVIEERQTAS